MEKRVWDVYAPDNKIAKIKAGLIERVEAMNGSVQRTSLQNLNGDGSRLHVNLKTPGGEQGVAKVIRLIRWIARQGGTVNGS